MSAASNTPAFFPQRHTAVVGDPTPMGAPGILTHIGARPCFHVPGSAIAASRPVLAIPPTGAPDPLLAKPGQDVQHCRWRRTMRSKVSILVRQWPCPFVSLVDVTVVSTRSPGS